MPGVLTSLVAPLALMLVALPTAAQTRQSIINYASIHQPVVARHGMVVAQNDLAAAVGRDVLAQGGNAIDAAVAMGFALAVTLPRAGNLGGGGFMLVHLGGEGRTIALDYRSVAPGASSDALFRGEDGKLDWEALTYGPRAAAVPGTVAGLYEAWQRWGSLPWPELVAPALALATEGIEISEDLAYALGEASETLRRFEASAAAYLPPGERNWVAGERIVQPDLAASLALISKDGAEAFYRGELAQRIVAAMESAGGLITLEDLASYRVVEREPVTGNYRGYRVLSMPPPSAGGATLVQMLNMLSVHDLQAMGAGSAAELHLLAEVMKRAAANRRTWLGDPDYSEVPLAEFVDPLAARRVGKAIDLKRATPAEAVEPWPLGIAESQETTHYSVVDAEGNAVSNTYTLGYSFGSGWVAAGTGILFDNQMRNFTFRETDSPHPNALAPGKRMLSTMAPTIVFDEAGRLSLVTGTPGGSDIINVLLQVLVNVIDHDLNVAEASHRPRISQDWKSPTLRMEPGFSPEVIEGVRARGHEVAVGRTMGSTQSIAVRDERLEGAADPRRPNAVALGLLKPSGTIPMNSPSQTPPPR
ncbi:MAG: gamma-glutamyltransferase [Steroidobacteraceae bacterium]